MNCVIWDESQMLEAPLPDAARAWLHEVVEPALQELTADQYRDGPAVLLTTEARFVYVVGDDRVWWVVEWPPGIVVVRFTSDGGYAAARLEVPDDEHPAVELVASPWAAQLDEAERRDAGFAPASDTTEAIWASATVAVQALGEALSGTLSDENAVEAWRTRASDSPWVRDD